MIRRRYAAGADVGEALQMAEGGDLDPVLARDLEDGVPGLTGDVPALDGQGEHAHRATSPAATAASRGSILQTPAGQT
jgi:hypothetical protein